MSTTLVSLVGGADIVVNRPILIIGRHADCDVALDSKKISRQHCCIASLKDKLLVRDLGSTNGVRVNGLKQEECQLVSGDELVIGNLRYRVDSTEYRSRKPADAPRRVSDVDLEQADIPVALEDEEGLETELADESAAPEGRQNPPDSSWLKLPNDVRLKPISEMDVHRPGPSDRH